MAGRAAWIIATLLPATCLAFSNTNPIVAWSAHSSNVLDSASSAKSSWNILEDMLLDKQICQHDAIVLVDQKGLHASDLRTLPTSSVLSQSLYFAASALEMPYVTRSISHPYENLVHTVAEHCDARVVHHTPGQMGIPYDAKEKHVVCIEMPALESPYGTTRKSIMAEHESALSSTLSELSDVFPNHIVVYAGWSPSLRARQSSDPFSSTAVVNPSAAFAPPDGGILARYQLLTPGLIISLLVGFFVLLPTVLMGINALAAIKSPLQGEPPKGYIASEKKNQ
ncbi:hypothetical protein WOLCODRAFT_137520 [Wolfiporia cocos MD-104 SS10]|uniref:Protein BIG1 n=1 Tax=Wolfiporia cocos (strain MD-104) TaxID=742152 RepID=A0A2H3JZQ6_WOLCO|nr:hypothetical protein WOLCODRAFT_137520 [Wolfiporia cocos MD-104 SS10]